MKKVLLSSTFFGSLLRNYGFLVFSPRSEWGIVIPGTRVVLRSLCFGLSPYRSLWRGVPDRELCLLATDPGGLHQSRHRLSGCPFCVSWYAVGRLPSGAPSLRRRLLPDRFLSRYRWTLLLLARVPGQHDRTLCRNREDRLFWFTCPLFKDFSVFGSFDALFTNS